MARKRKRTVTPAPRPRHPRVPDLDHLGAQAAAGVFWTAKTAVPLDGRRRRR